jgi:hypothetical protein
MWFDTGSKTLPAGIDAELAKRIERDDRTDHTWLNVDTGAVVVVACDGGWRTASTSQYKAFYRAPGAVDIIDVTFALTGRLEFPFDPDQGGSNTYTSAQRAIGDRVTEALDARQVWK